MSAEIWQLVYVVGAAVVGYWLRHTNVFKHADPNAPAVPVPVPTPLPIPVAVPAVPAPGLPPLPPEVIDIAKQIHADIVAKQDKVKADAIAAVTAPK